MICVFGIYHFVLGENYLWLTPLFFQAGTFRSIYLHSSGCDGLSIYIKTRAVNPPILLQTKINTYFEVYSRAYQYVCFISRERFVFFNQHQRRRSFVVQDILSSRRPLCYRGATGSLLLCRRFLFLPLISHTTQTTQTTPQVSSRWSSADTTISERSVGKARSRSTTVWSARGPLSSTTSTPTRLGTSGLTCTTLERASTAPPRASA